MQEPGIDGAKFLKMEVHTILNTVNHVSLQAVFVYAKDCCDVFTLRSSKICLQFLVVC